MNCCLRNANNNIYPWTKEYLLQLQSSSSQGSPPAMRARSTTRLYRLDHVTWIKHWGTQCGSASKPLYKADISRRVDEGVWMHTSICSIVWMSRHPLPYEPYSIRINQISGLQFYFIFTYSTCIFLTSTNFASKTISQNFGHISFHISFKKYLISLKSNNQLKTCIMMKELTTRRCVPGVSLRRPYSLLLLHCPCLLPAAWYWPKMKNAVHQIRKNIVAGLLALL